VLSKIRKARLLITDDTTINYYKLLLLHIYFSALFSNFLPMITKRGIIENGIKYEISILKENKRKEIE
jgi:hypothetical protein